MKTAFILLSAASAAYAQVNTWGQCGGVGYTGSTSCVPNVYCSTLNPYYAQCVPGTAKPTTTPSTTAVASTTPKITTTTTPKITTTTPVVTTTSARPTTTPSVITTSASSTTSSRTTLIISTTPSKTTAVSSPTGAPGPGPGSTLQTNWLWIRCVEAPNFHKYLQSQTLRTTTDAVMADYTTAGQFNIVNGQLEQLIDTTGDILYATVQQSTGAENKLLVSFQSTPNTYGTFSFSGDAVEWNVAGLTRQNAAAWLICESQHLYVNLGAYGYMTPAGCADGTIHYYNGATAVNKK